MDLPSLQVTLVLKLASVDLENASSTTILFHTALLFRKEWSSRLREYGEELMEFAGLHMFPTIQMQVEWQDDERVFRRCNHSPAMY